MALNGQKISDAMNALLPSDGSSTDRTRVGQAFLETTKEAFIPISATLNCGVFAPRMTILVTDVKVEPMAALASSATTFWQFQLVYDDDAGSGTGNTSITTTISGSVTALVANVPQAFTLSTTGGVQVPANKRVALKVTKNDTPAANNVGLRITYKEIG